MCACVLRVFCPYVCVCVCMFPSPPLFKSSFLLPTPSLELFAPTGYSNSHWLPSHIGEACLEIRLGSNQGAIGEIFSITHVTVPTLYIPLAPIVDQLYYWKLSFFCFLFLQRNHSTGRHQLIRGVHEFPGGNSRNVNLVRVYCGFCRRTNKHKSNQNTQPQSSS